jgi:hypothetical protein
MNDDEKHKESMVIEEETRISKFRRIILPKAKGELSEPIEKDILKGKSLKVYWYLFENGPAGVREIQRALKYNSPGIITYQIKKLAEHEFIVKDEITEKYDINIRVKAGLLHFYVKIGPRLIPRFSLYLMGFLIGFVIYFLGSVVGGDTFITHPVSVILLLVLIFGSLAFIYESRMIKKLKPYS